MFILFSFGTPVEKIYSSVSPVDELIWICDIIIILKFILWKSKLQHQSLWENLLGPFIWNMVHFLYFSILTNSQFIEGDEEADEVGDGHNQLKELIEG